MLVNEKKIDTVLNLGAGLDTRPYRLDIPHSLRWIEVDFPNIIDHKEQVLKNEKPKCQLERVKLDLSNRDERTKFFEEVSEKSQSFLIITEGVLPYLSNQEVSELAFDLKLFPKFNYWIAEYMSQKVIQYLMSSTRQKKMKNAPFKFAPVNWFSFFSENGWSENQTKYTGIEGKRLGRLLPAPWWVKILSLLMSQKTKMAYGKMSGYTLYVPKK